jgi:hypothetical protein
MTTIKSNRESTRLNANKDLSNLLIIREIRDIRGQILNRGQIFLRP